MIGAVVAGYFRKDVIGDDEAFMMPYFAGTFWGIWLPVYCVVIGLIKTVSFFMRAPFRFGEKIRNKTDR